MDTNKGKILTRETSKERERRGTGIQETLQTKDSSTTTVEGGGNRKDEERSLSGAGQ